MLEKLEYFTSTIAAITLIIFSIIGKKDLTYIAVRLVIVIIVFYFVGIIVKRYLKKKVFINKEINKDVEDLIDDVEHADLEDKETPE